MQMRMQIGMRENENDDVRSRQVKKIMAVDEGLTTRVMIRSSFTNRQPAERSKFVGDSAMVRKLRISSSIRNERRRFRRKRFTVFN